MATPHRGYASPPASLRYAGEMGGSQFITISQDPPSRRWLKALLLAILLLPLAWNIFTREWDYRAAYSGVIVEKGMDCGIYCLLGHTQGADLYIVLQDEQGKRFKRYVGTTFHSNLRAWNQLTVGTFVVKNKGAQEFPREPGAKAPTLLQSPPQTSSSILFLAYLFCGGVFLIGARQLWKTL